MNRICLYISIICFCIQPFYMSAQNTIEHKDSILLEKYDAMMKIPVDTNLNDIEAVGIRTSKPDLEYVPETKGFSFSTPGSTNIYFPFLPYHYSSRNFVEGFTLQGIQNQFAISDFLSVGLNFYISNQYNGIFQPTPYMNAHARLDLILKLHDRVQVVGMGQISVREGLNPKIPSTVGNANFYGIGLQFKVTKKIGFGFGVTNSFYRGNWTKQTYFSPVGF